MRRGNREEGRVRTDQEVPAEGAERGQQKNMALGREGKSREAQKTPWPCSQPTAWSFGSGLRTCAPLGGGESLGGLPSPSPTCRLRKASPSLPPSLPAPHTSEARAQEFPSFPTCSPLTPWHFQLPTP